MATCMYGLERLLSSCYRDRCLIWAVVVVVVVLLLFRQGYRGGQGARQQRERSLCGVSAGPSADLHPAVREVMA